MNSEVFEGLRSQKNLISQTAKIMSASKKQVTHLLLYTVADVQQFF